MLKLKLRAWLTHSLTQIIHAQCPNKAVLFQPRLAMMTQLPFMASWHPQRDPQAPAVCRGRKSAAAGLAIPRGVQETAPTEAAGKLPAGQEESLLGRRRRRTMQLDQVTTLIILLGLLSCFVCLFQPVGLYCPWPPDLDNQLECST